MNLRSLVAATTAALVVTLVPSAAPTAEAASVRVNRSNSLADAVPAGSYLAVVQRGPHGGQGSIDPRTQRLELVSATGETRTVYTRKVSRRYGGFRLLDWSVDGSRALLSVTEKGGSRAIVVDVKTGAAQELVVPLLETAVLDLAGNGILAATWKNGHSNTMVLDLISWSGTRTRLLDSTDGSVMPGRNGTVITRDGKRGRFQLVISTSTGAVMNRFRGHGSCTPVRWWDDTRLLEMCGKNLYLVDPATGSADRLTSRHAKGDISHLDARFAGDRLYVQVAGGCGYSFVARKTRSGELRHLRVPGAMGSVNMVAAAGGDLVLQHAANCEGKRPRSVLSLFDPVHHEETPLLALGKHETFGGIRVLGEVRASTY